MAPKSKPLPSFQGSIYIYDPLANSSWHEKSKHITQQHYQLFGAYFLPTELPICFKWFYKNLIKNSRLSERLVLKTNVQIQKYREAWKVTSQRKQGKSSNSMQFGRSSSGSRWKIEHWVPGTWHEHWTLSNKHGHGSHTIPYLYCIVQCWRARVERQVLKRLDVGFLPTCL